MPSPSPHSSKAKILAALDLDSIADRAHALVRVSFFAAVLEGASELRGNKSTDRDELFLKEKSASLVQLASLYPLLSEGEPKSWRALGKNAASFADELILAARRDLGRDELRLFSEIAMQDAARLIRDQKQFHSNFFAHHLDRAFDCFDALFGLHFSGERPDQASRDTERAFIGAGIGVQSDYAAIFDSLEKLSPPPSSTMIDLGSGYGRVGLVMGLLRPDMTHIGYEIVEHRVEMSNQSVGRLGIADRVKFIAQDLAAITFQIPPANIYYLYDPFTKETYRSVLAQLKRIGRERPVTIATRGHAVYWVSEALGPEGWSFDLAPSEGQLSLFRSPSP